MKNRSLGTSKIESSEIGLGCWQFGGDFGPISEHEVRAVLEGAMTSGIQFWDTADVYGQGRSERLIGAFLADRPDLRSHITVATKVGRSDALYPDKYSKKLIKTHIEASLKRLQMECLDLVQLHCIPEHYVLDGEVFDWLRDFQQAGLIHRYGASVETIEQAKICMRDDMLASVQIIFNVFRQDAAWDLLPEAQDKGVGIIVRLPLASGLLTGKFTAQTHFDTQDHRHYNRDGEVFNVGETFSGIPFEKGLTLMDELKEICPPDIRLADFSLRWILDHPAVSTVIAGVSNADQLRRNALVSALPPLGEAIHQQLKQFYQQRVRDQIRGDI